MDGIMKLKLSSGREVEINRPSVKDRIRCGDISTFRFEVTGYKGTKPNLGEAVMTRVKEASFEWAACGLGVSLDALDEYSDQEVMEIGAKVKDLSELNPKKDPS
jgi:hypothetical protein